MALTRSELCSMWPLLDRPLAHMEAWDGPRGLLFESDPESAYEAVMAAAAILGGRIEKFEQHPTIKQDWVDRAGRYLSGEVPPGALFETGKTKLAIIVLNLDLQPQWLQFAIKGPMDRSNPPFKAVNFLATTDDADKLSPSVRSMFHVVRKTGRRRGKMK